MRKSTIWLLAVVMAFAFAGLLFLQVKYVSIILKKSSEQFNETVKRSLHQVSKNLELDETQRYLEEDLKRDESYYLQNNQDPQEIAQTITQQKLQIKDANGNILQIDQLHSFSQKFEPLSSLDKKQTSNNIISTSQDLQKTLMRRLKYQNALMQEVLVNILNTANLKPIQERVDFKKLNNYLKSEFINNGLNLPFIFFVINKDGKTVYQSGEIKKEPIASDIITYVLFPNDPPSKLNYLKVYFRNIYCTVCSFLADTVGNIYLYHIYCIPPEETVRNEERLYQQYDARAENSGFHYLAGGTDVERLGYNEKPRCIQTYIRRDK